MLPIQGNLCNLYPTALGEVIKPDFDQVHFPLGPTGSLCSLRVLQLVPLGIP